MQPRTCPRCGALLPPEAYYEQLTGVATDRMPGFVVRHPILNAEGKKVGVCIGYAGPASDDPAYQSSSASK
jgi:hypothetical protein